MSHPAVFFLILAVVLFLASLFFDRAGLWVARRQGMTCWSVQGLVVVTGMVSGSSVISFCIGIALYIWLLFDSSTG